MLRVVERNTRVKIRTHFLQLWSSDGNKGNRTSSFILPLPYYRCTWLINPGNYTHCTLRVLIMLRVVERNAKVKIRTHFLHLWSSGGNKGYRTSSSIPQLPYYRWTWLGNPGNYTHCTLRLLTMLSVVERNTKVKIRTHFLHLWSSGGNKGYRTSSFIPQLLYYRSTWLGNPGNYTHCTLRVLTMLRVHTCSPNKCSEC